jgi:branched-chain amino acid transport system substrate-binding protein
MRKIAFFIQISLLIIFVFASCNKDETTDTTGRKIAIGLLLPLTGSGASAGESAQSAINIAYQEINNYLKDAGSDWRLDLIFEDTKTDTLVVLQKLTDFKDKNIQVVIGPYTSVEVKRVKDYADQTDMMIVSPASVIASLAIPNDNIFRLVPNSLSLGEAMTALLKDDSIEILVPVMRDDIWGDDLLMSTSQWFTQEGGTVTDAARYSPSTQDFNATITELRNKVADALTQHAANTVGVYLLCYDEGITILNLASSDEVLQKVKWYGNTAYSENKSLPLDMTAAVFASSHSFLCPIFGLDMSAKDKWQPLIDQIEAQIGRKPEIYALASYDALWLATLTFLTVGHYTDIATLKKTFVYNANNYFGVTGRTTLDNSGDRAYATYDFWGIKQNLNDFEWQLDATYNNMTGELVRY